MGEINWVFSLIGFARCVVPVLLILLLCLRTTEIELFVTADSPQRYAALVAEGSGATLARARLHGVVTAPPESHFQDESTHKIPIIDNGFSFNFVWGLSAQRAFSSFLV